MDEKLTVSIRFQATDFGHVWLLTPRIPVLLSRHDKGRISH